MPKKGRNSNILICNQLQWRECIVGRVRKQADALKLCAMHVMIYVIEDANRLLNRYRRCQLRFDLLFNYLYGRANINHLHIRFGAILQLKLPLLE
jgi:hypothetical protein